MASLISLAEADERMQKIKNNLALQLNQSAQKQVATIKQRLMIYPAPRPGSRYRRTYMLRKGWEGWKPQVLDGSSAYYNVHIRLENPLVKYWKFVQDEQSQSKANRVRWETVQEIVRAYYPTLVKMVEHDLQNYIDLTLSRG